MPAIDALALFYDFRELTPVGSRGDEMIRRLAERLVSVDLLDQAADLLQYQVDHRLEGAARAEVATRLAVIYLMNRKPDRALAALRASRSPDLAQSLRDQRLLLEARALSDLGRHDLALEVIADIPGPAAIRLRSDILWAGRRWREAAEQIELMYGDRYKDFAPLTDVERQDILRAEIGFALAEDSLGLGRFRDKYAAKMAGTPDARAFDIVSAPLGTSGDEFGAIAHAAASRRYAGRLPARHEGALSRFDGAVRPSFFAAGRCSAGRAARRNKCVRRAAGNPTRHAAARRRRQDGIELIAISDSDACPRHHRA